MSELDYAFVAEFAKVELGKLTAVGASYIAVQPLSFPAMHNLAIAGRVRAPVGTDAVGIAISVSLPGDSPAIEMEGTLTPNESSAVYDNKFGIVFAVSTTVRLDAAGLVEVNISLDGTHRRRLAFDVLAPS